MMIPTPLTTFTRTILRINHSGIVNQPHPAWLWAVCAGGLLVLPGFAAAALATGNTVLLKPSRHAAVTAAHLMDVVTTSHIPDGVVNFLPGSGDDIGRDFAGHPDIDMVAFAGSQAIGMQVHEHSAIADDRRPRLGRLIAGLGAAGLLTIGWMPVGWVGSWHVPAPGCVSTTATRSKSR